MNRKEKNNIVQATGISLDYRNFRVLENVSFQLKQRSFISFVGPSGCGKTTLLNIVAGINKNYTGEISINAERISFVFQKDSLLEWRSVLSNVLLPLEISGIRISKNHIKNAEELIDRVGLKGYENFFPYQLSGGMKKRVEIAAALINSPDLLILDEPFSQLDILTRERLNIMIKTLFRKNNMSVIMVTHSVEEACFLSDTVYVMSSRPGRIILRKKIQDSENRQQYLLSEGQQSANIEIRKHAQNLWRPERISGDEIEKEKTDFSGLLKKHLSLISFPAVLFLLILFLTWMKSVLQIEDYIFPQPLSIIKRFGEMIFQPFIYRHLLTTVIESMGGFLIAFIFSFIGAIGIAKSRIIKSIFMPFLLTANTIPSIALAPFLVLWFGFGFTPKILSAAIVVFLPMLINNISAINLAGEKLSDIIKFYRPGFFSRFFKFELPQSLPVIFSGIEISITLSVIGAVVGEFVSGAEGLGSLVTIAKSNFDIELMFAALIWLSLLSLTYYGLAKLTYKIIIGGRK
ncbi:MAG: ATP-binding cassette domain-containing protein [Spirochaetes bacterium]|nr:ATP-binding cassette domain-containing protein [Spirochaetota bacterium]